MVSQLELEQYVHPSRSSNVNVEKICQVAKTKLKHSELANGLIRFLIFAAIYMTVIYYQRNSEMASDIDGMLRKIVLETQYRDPWSFQQKTFQDISTIDEFWDWHLYALLPRILQNDYYNGDPVPQNDYGTIHMHSRIINEIRLIQRRAKNGTCDALPYLSNFSSECYGSTYFDGTWGNVDTESFIGRDEKSVYVFESFPSGSPGSTGLFATVLLKFWISNTGNFKMAYELSMKRNESDAASCMLRLVPVSWQDYVRMAGELIVVIFWLFFVKREVERVGELAEEYGYLTAYLFHNSINTIKFEGFSSFSLGLITVFEYMTGSTNYEEMYWGFLRRIYYLRGVLPQDFQKRLNRTSKLKYFRGIESKTCVDFYELESLVAMNHNVTSMTLIDIINEYDAWIPKSHMEKVAERVEAHHDPGKMDAVPQALQSLRVAESLRGECLRLTIMTGDLAGDCEL
ncbi:hypothetical protein GUITHDRAFT_133659 [Guillardia theta CCMP2712]|uniref:Polycystin domain-containing protein n=1 Tax=Guillardia theta (strain CCMP2712) TaxID=905079 RepID=L1JW93_GUITC|nr:hypothetical protein GUITHDRAFT_133659 [Guillardia theta CCMP2712]EKX52609.1 hypothetical protein GUITHDRAFT_133659 [Guillardia theta CCMP2712]|eukprot:XP_005839589.1 hypothetical protein GUITHDRAFT_133659 [Guillardia theta CCMP2712]